MSSYSIFNTTLSSIGRALRYRLNENNYYHPSEMPDAINRIPLKQQDPYPLNQNIAFVNFASFNEYWNYYIVDNADVPNSYGNITRISTGYGIPIYAKTYHGNCYLFTNEGYTFPEHLYGYGAFSSYFDINWIINHKILTNYVSYFSFGENFTLENILSYNFSNLKYLESSHILSSTNNLSFLNNYNIKYLDYITPLDICYMEEPWIGNQVEALQGTYSSTNFIFNCQRIKCPQTVKYMSLSFTSTMGRPTEAEIPEGLIVGYGAFQFSNKIQHYYCNGANSLTNLKYAQYMFARDHGPIDATIENRINFHFNFNTPYIMNYQMIFRNTPYYGPVLKKPITYVLTNDGLKWLYASGLIYSNILNPQQVILNNIDRDLPKHGYEFPDICFPYTNGTLEYIVSNVDDFGQFNNFYFKFGNITMLNNNGMLNFRDFFYPWTISEDYLNRCPIITQTNVKTIGDFGEIYSAGSIYAYYIDWQSKGRRNTNFFPHLTCGGINVGNIICEKNFEQIIGFQTNFAPTAYAPNMTSIGSYKNIISYNGNINTGDMQGTPFVLSNKEAPPNYRCNYLTIGNIIAYNGNVDLNMMLYKKALGGCTEGFQCHDIIGQNINLSYLCGIQSWADAGDNTINHYLINAPKIHDVIATHNINCGYGLFPTGHFAGYNFPYLVNGISINLLKADNIYLSDAFYRGGVIGQHYSVENLKNLGAINLIECNNLYGYGCFEGYSSDPSLQTNIDQFEMNVKCSNNLYWGYFLRYSFYNNAIFRFYYNQNSASVNPSIDIRFTDWISVRAALYHKITVYVEKDSPYDLQLYNRGQINNQVINCYWDTNETTGQPELISNYNMIWTVIPNGYCNSKSNIYIYNNL